MLLAAMLVVPAPAQAFFCFGFSVGGGPRMSFGGPRYYGPPAAYAPYRYGYYAHPGWQPPPYGHAGAGGWRPPRYAPPPFPTPYPMPWPYPRRW